MTKNAIKRNKKKVKKPTSNLLSPKTQPSNIAEPSNSVSQHQFAICGKSYTGMPFMLLWNSEDNMLKSVDLPKDTELFKYSGATMKDSNTMLLCGGRSIYTKKIANIFYNYSVSANKFIKMPEMIQGKYDHSVHYWNGRLYVVGGMTCVLLNHQPTARCEVFDFETYKWIGIASLKRPKSKTKLFIYNNELWSLGGEEENKSLSREIDVYNLMADKWTVLDFYIPCYKPQLNLALAGNPNEIFIIFKKVKL